MVTATEKQKKKEKQRSGPHCRIRSKNLNKIKNCSVSTVDEIFIEDSMKIKFARQQIFHMLFAKFVCNQMYINSSLWNY